MNDSEYRPRLSIELPQEKYDRLKFLLPHGTKKIVFNLIVDDLIELIERHGAGNIIGAFIQRDITLQDLTRTKFDEGTLSKDTKRD